MPETPFDNIESAQEYMTLLAQAVEEAIGAIEEESTAAVSEKADRREQALRMVAFKLTKLNGHLKESRRILNDLRTLRRLLLDERGRGADEADDEAVAPPDPGTGEVD
jgi:hypothetical protein